MEDILQEIRKKGRNQGLIAIQAQKEIILKAIDEGSTLKTIHSVLTGRGLMPVKYCAFARLVKKHLKKPPKTQTSPQIKKIKEITPKTFKKTRLICPQNEYFE